MAELMHLLDGGWDQIVMEDFIGAGNLTREGKCTIELIGAVKGYCICSQYSLKMQAPQRRKAFQLEAHNTLMVRGTKFVIHEEDALAHLLRFEYGR